MTTCNLVVFILENNAPAELHHTSGFRGVSCFGGGGEGTPHCNATKPFQHSSFARGRDATLTLQIAGEGTGDALGALPTWLFTGKSFPR